MPLWRARRVVSGLRGSLKSEGLEAPFVGRDRELRQIKDLFHACADEGRAHLVSVTGIAGIGKSRLPWEFYKYFDGIAADRLLAPRPLPALRRGRDLLGARRHGADALPDRGGRGAGAARARSSRRRSTSTSSTPTSARFVEPRLAHLLGPRRPRRRATGRTSSPPGGCSSSGSRDVYPTVLVFEDVQWADESLLDFVEYLLDWSRNHPLLRDHARPARAARAPADLGRGPAQLHLALPRAAARAGDDGAAGRPRPRPSRRAARADPRPRRGRAALRRRDGADAPRPRPARAGRLVVQPHRRGRGARGAGDAARADRRPARRPAPGRAPPAPGRRRARQDLHARRRSPRSPGSTRSGSSRLLALARAQGGARRSRPTRARRSTASTAICRTSSGTSPTRRCRSASVGRGISPRPRSSRPPSPATRTRWSR